MVCRNMLPLFMDFTCWCMCQDTWRIYRFDCRPIHSMPTVVCVLLVVYVQYNGLNKYSASVFYYTLLICLDLVRFHYIIICMWESTRWESGVTVIVVCVNIE